MQTYDVSVKILDGNGNPISGAFYAQSLSPHEFLNGDISDALEFGFPFVKDNGPIPGDNGSGGPYTILQGQGV